MKNQLIKKSLRGPVPLSHLLLRQFVFPGDTVIDATCGNGGDTLLLAELVASIGRVFAFDIQQQAIKVTGQKLNDSGLANRVTLIHDSHENISKYCLDGIAAVVFNLGYLPAADHLIITTVETTMSALCQAQQLLKVGGIVAITLYPGHSGGELEKDAIECFVANLSPREWHVWQMHQLNVSSTAPLFIFLQKAS